MKYRYKYITPVMYSDPSGQSIVLSGTTSDKNWIIYVLNQLAGTKYGNKFTYNSKGVVSSVGGTIQYTESYRLIMALIGHSRTCYIRIAANGAGSEFKPASNTDNSNGKGCNGTVWIDQTQAGKYQIPQYTIMAHELLHALRAMKGITSKKLMRELYGLNQWTPYFWSDEYYVIGLLTDNRQTTTENKIRKEHGWPLRLSYIKL